MKILHNERALQKSRLIVTFRQAQCDNQNVSLSMSKADNGFWIVSYIKTRIGIYLKTIIQIYKCIASP